MKPKTPKPHRFDGPNGKVAARDVARFGREVAIFNHGFLNGHDDGKEKGFERACLLIMGDKVKWTPAERRLCNRVTRKLFGKKQK